MDDSIRTAKYYAPNYTALPTRQCLVCGTLENYSVYTAVVDASLPWLCDRCKSTLQKLIEDANTSNALNALEQENEELTDTNVGKWIPVAERLPEPYTWVLVSAEEHNVAFDAFYDGAQWKDAVLNGLIVTHWMPLPKPPKENEDER